MSPAFHEALFPEGAAVIEIFPWGENAVGALLLKRGHVPKLLGKYPQEITAREDRPLFRMEQPDSALLEEDLRRFRLLCDPFARDLHDALQGEVTGQLVLCPGGWMSELPLHAAEIANGTVLGDVYPCVYAPSATVYALCRSRRRSEGTAVAVIDPRGELSYSDYEERSLRASNSLEFRFMGNGSPFDWDTFREVVRGCRLLHVSAHGYQGKGSFGFTAGVRTGPGSGPQNREEDLSAYQAFWDGFPGLDTAVVILSSCHAGETFGPAEEPIGLPGALLIGGAKSVVAPLWQLEEFSTALFMQFFYEGVSSALSLASAVGRAQKRLRTVTTEQVVRELDAFNNSNHPFYPIRQAYRAHLVETYAATACPFANPFYWGAFRVLGCDMTI